MSMMISIARVSTTENPINSATYHADHNAVFGDAMETKAILRDPNDAYQVAVFGEFKDLERVRSVSRTPAGDAMMRIYGFVEQLSDFLEG